MPKLWADSVEAHREQVRALVFEAIEELAATRGLLAVNMSRLAEATGIGRATLYKYFGDIEEVLAAWHQRRVAGHLAELEGLALQPGDEAVRLRAVLEEYGRIGQHSSGHGTEALVAALHHGDRMAPHHQRLHGLFADLLSDAAATGAVRRDVPADELARYCLRAMAAAADATSDAALGRLVDVVLRGVGGPATGRTVTEEGR